MFRLTIPAVFAALMVGTAAVAEPQIVSKIEVSVDLNAIQNEKAAAYWQTLSADLNSAIVTRLGNQIAAGGANVTVDISELELASSFQSAVGVADSRLVGDVQVRKTDTDVDLTNYQLTVSFTDASPFFPKDTDMAKITTDSPEYYTAMLDAFADRVVAFLN